MICANDTKEHVLTIVKNFTLQEATITLLHNADKMLTSVDFQQTTWCYILEEWTLQILMYFEMASNYTISDVGAIPAVITA
jgi:mannose/fructose/N-acetylgalactosamine-specific phosphotransferase system component IIC